MSQAQPLSSSSNLESVLYDAFMCAEEPDDVEFFAELLDPERGPALELGCGSGRVLLELLAQGYPVEGLDSDFQMIKTAQARAASLGLQVPLHHARMEDFQPQTQYASLYFPGFSFQLLSEKALALQALKSWQNWLLPEGQLLLSCYWPWEADEGVRKTDWELYNTIEGEFLTHWLESASYPQTQQANKAHCFTCSELELESQQLTRFHRYELRDAQDRLLAEDQSALKQRYWSPEELSQTAHDLGFSQIEFFSGFTPHPLEEGDSLWTLKLSR